MDFTPLRKYLNGLIEKGVPGLELAICRDHEILFHECMGYSDYGRTVKAAPSDRYWMYSCTKPMLIRHLFTMTAGLDYNKLRGGVQRVLDETDRTATTVQLAEAMAEEALSFEPGARFQYSLCHDVLGAVIEKVSGMNLREYMKRNIFEPLGMENTDFWTAEETPQNLAAQYAYNPQAGRLEEFTMKNDFILSSNYFGGGAGLLSTCGDYLKFTDAMSCGGVSAQGVRILKSETIDLMRSEQIPEYRAEGSFTCTCGPDYGYGLGVRTRIAFNHGEKSALGEFGWDGAAGADMTMDPEHRLSVMFMTHIRNWPSMLGAVHLQLRDVIYPMMGL